MRMPAKPVPAFFCAHVEAQQQDALGPGVNGNVDRSISTVAAGLDVARIGVETLCACLPKTQDITKLNRVHACHLQSSEFERLLRVSAPPSGV